MVQPISDSSPLVTVRSGSRQIDALPVLLRGDEASLVMDQIPPTQVLDLVLSWPDGRRTHLDTRLHAVDGGGRIAHLKVVGIRDDWQPFLEYLGRSSVTP